MEMGQRGRKKRIVENKVEKICRKCGVEEGCIEHIMSLTRIKIELGKDLDERVKGEVVK